MTDTVDSEKEEVSFHEGGDIDRTLTQLFLRDVQSCNACTRRFTKEELLFLVKRIADGESDAVHELAMSAVLYMVKIARTYIGRTSDAITLADLYSVGYFGLVHAAKKFDPTRGAFTTYATHWVHQHLQREFMNQERLVRLPVHMVQELSRFLRLRKEIEKEGGAAPVSVLAARMGISVAHAAHLEEYGNSFTVSASATDDPEGEEESFVHIVVSDANGPDAILLESDMQCMVRQCLQELPERERTILERYYGFHAWDGETLESIADTYGITRERIRQLKLETMKKIKHRLAQKGILASFVTDI